MGGQHASQSLGDGEVVTSAVKPVSSYLTIRVLNQWIAQLDPSINRRFASTSRKLGIVREAARQKLQQNRVAGKRYNLSVAWLEISKTKELRNAISHLQPSDDQFAMFQ